MACFLDTSTANVIADGVKFNQEERAGAGHAFLLQRDYLKLAVGAQVVLLTNLSQDEGLVNGSRGIITSFDNGKPVVLFVNGIKSTCI